MSEDAGAVEPPVVPMEDPAFWSDIHPMLARALQHGPVARTPGGGVVILGANEVEHFLRDPGNRTVDLLARGGIVDGPLHDWWEQVMFSTDPPAHTRLRALVSRAFTPRQAERMRHPVAALTHELLQPHLAAGEIDLVEDIAHQLPIRVMGQLLAVPDADYDRFATWTADLGLVFSAVVDPGLRRHLETTVVALGDYVTELIADRRRRPGADLLSQLIEAEEAGDRLSEDELVALVMNLLFAGHDTTRSLLQIAFVVLLEHPTERVALEGDPTRAAAVVEEVLRFEPPVMGSARQPVVDTLVGGVTLRAGSPVAVSLPAANRDPRRYPDPHRFVPDRWMQDPAPPPVMSFGRGAHYCLGAALARIEAQVAVPIVLETLPGLELMERPTWVPYASIRRYERLPARFEAPDS